MRPSENEPQIAAIAGRLRDFLVRQPGFRASSFALDAGLAEPDVRGVVIPERGLVDANALVDVIAAVIRHYGVDANWILTGDYDPATHRSLDAEGRLGSTEVRQLIAERLPSWSPSRAAVQFPA
jgi:hypothetical protein